MEGALNPVIIPLECNGHVPSSLQTKISLVPRTILGEHVDPPINVCLMNDSTSCMFCLYSYPTWNFAQKKKMHIDAFLCGQFKHVS